MAKPVRKRVDSLVPKNDLPPNPIVSRFITLFVGHRDLELAACQVRLAPEMGKRLYANEKVRNEIDRKIMLVDVEEAKMRAKSSLLTVPLLDSSLVEEIKSKRNGHIRLRAIELGYKRTGLIREGEFFVPTNPNDKTVAPSIYQSRQKTTMRTVTEEVTTETMVTAAIAAPLPAPKAEQPTFRVIEY